MKTVQVENRSGGVLVLFFPPLTPGAKRIEIKEGTSTMPLDVALVAEERLGVKGVSILRGRAEPGEPLCLEEEAPLVEHLPGEIDPRATQHACPHGTIVTGPLDAAFNEIQGVEATAAPEGKPLPLAGHIKKALPYIPPDDEAASVYYCRTCAKPFPSPKSRTGHENAVHRGAKA